MESILNQEEILLHVLSFALPRMPSPPANKPNPSTVTLRQTFEMEHVSELDRVRDVVHQGFVWLASLRTVNQSFCHVIDQPSSLNPYSNLWFLSAVALELDPPIQLFATGTYQQVCQALLVDKVAQARQGQLRGVSRQRGMRYGCIMIHHAPAVRAPHPNPTSHHVKFPEDIASKIRHTAKALETFLRSINYTARPHDFSRNALERYQMFLFLKQQNPNTWLVPTADIEFCWLAHIFRTESYWKDMAAIGVDPQHSLLLSKSKVPVLPNAVKGTETLWNKTFGPLCPYLHDGFSVDHWWSNWRQRRTWHDEEIDRVDLSSFLPEVGPANKLPLQRSHLKLPTISLSVDQVQADLEWFPELQKGLQDISRRGYDVVGERGFSRRIDYPKLYAQHLVPSYERFLNLCLRDKIQGDVAPPYVLDLVWHAHQADPVAYKRDCLALFGREFWHHPWPQGLGVSTPLSQEFRCAWKQAYGSTIEEDWELRVTPTEATGNHHFDDFDNLFDNPSGGSTSEEE